MDTNLTGITRYDLEPAVYPDGPDACMVAHRQGDYVTFDAHNDIVTALQTELDAARKAIKSALEYLQAV